MAGVDLVAQDYPSAMEHLNLAIQMDSHSATAYQYRASLFGRLLQPEKAIADFSKAIEYGGSRDCLYGRGCQYHGTGPPGPGAQGLPDVLRQNIRLRKWQSASNASDAFYRLDNIQRSLAELQQSASRNPKTRRHS